MRACIPRFLFSRDAHMHPSVITRIIPGKFLRGFSCTAFASIRGYKPAVLLFPPPSSPRRNTSKERVISDKLAVLCAKRLVNGKNTPYDNFVWKFRKNSSPLVLRSLDYLDNSVQFLEFLFLQFYVPSPSNSRSSLSISEFFIFSFVARIEILDRIIDNEFLEIARFLNLLFHYYEILRDHGNNW